MLVCKQEAKYILLVVFIDSLTIHTHFVTSTLIQYVYINK